jgi:hypothetical protein
MEQLTPLGDLAPPLGDLAPPLGDLVPPALGVLVVYGTTLGEEGVEVENGGGEDGRQAKNGKGGCARRRAGKGDGSVVCVHGEGQTFIR